MAGWLSRTLTRLSAQPPQSSPQLLSPFELRNSLEAAKRMIAEKDFVSARAALKTIAVSNPDDADVLTHYGIATYMVGDPADARGALARAVQIEPNLLLAYKYLVSVSNALGDLQLLEIAASNALRLAPSDHEVLNMYGLACMNRFLVDDAAASFSKAVEVSPGDISGLINIEVLSMRSLRHRRGLDRSPKIATARSQAINRLRALYRRQQLDDTALRQLLMLLAGAKETFPTALEIAREIVSREEFGADLADQLAVIFLVVGDLPNLLRFRAIAVEDDPTQPLPRSNLAYARLSRGIEDWGESWKTIRDAERHTNAGVFAREVPAWTGQRLGRKKILVYREQGIGDAVIALRLIPMLAERGVRFDLWVSSALEGLAQSVKGYEDLVLAESRPDARTLACDYACSLFGLISALGIEHQELKANPTVLKPAANRLPDARSRLRSLKGRRVGLAYGGNPDRRDDWFRAIPLSALKRLAAVEGISWVNLVIDSRPEKPEVVKMFRMEDPMSEAKNFEDTAAIVSELDAVIAIDSSVAHLACRVGKPVWVLVPPMLDWRWQIGDDTRPWWPNATLLRGTSLGQWDGVIEELVRQLRG
jgi:tetratricopeptide (TPR) repeat protein